MVPGVWASASGALSAPGNVEGSGALCVMVVTWTAPNSDGGSAITSYSVDPLQNGSATPNAIPVTVSGGATTAKLPAYPGTYTVAVYATNQSGVTGPPGYSSPIAVTGRCLW